MVSGVRLGWAGMNFCFEEPVLAFEFVVMQEVSKSDLCFEITLVSFPPEFQFIQYKKKSTLNKHCIQFFKCISLQIQEVLCS